MKMAMAMADAIGGEKKVDYVNTHGTSTPVGDTMELNGIKTVFTGTRAIHSLAPLFACPLPRSRAHQYGPCEHPVCALAEAGYQPFVGSTKSLSGHALGAAGVHEAIYSLLMVRDGFLAESANIVDLVEEAEGMNILTKRHDGQVDRVMSNSFGFGGTNACLIFDRWTE